MINQKLLWCLTALVLFLYSGCVGSYKRDLNSSQEISTKPDTGTGEAVYYEEKNNHCDTILQRDQSINLSSLENLKLFNGFRQFMFNKPIAYYENCIQCEDSVMYKYCRYKGVINFSNKSKLSKELENEVSLYLYFINDTLRKIRLYTHGYYGHIDVKKLYIKFSKVFGKPNFKNLTRVDIEYFNAKKTVYYKGQKYKDFKESAQDPGYLFSEERLTELKKKRKISLEETIQEISNEGEYDRIQEIENEKMPRMTQKVNFSFPKYQEYYAAWRNKVILEFKCTKTKELQIAGSYHVKNEMDRLFFTEGYRFSKSESAYFNFYESSAAKKQFSDHYKKLKESKKDLKNKNKKELIEYF